METKTLYQPNLLALSSYLAFWHERSVCICVAIDPQSCGKPWSSVSLCYTPAHNLLSFSYLVLVICGGMMALDCSLHPVVSVFVSWMYLRCVGCSVFLYSRSCWICESVDFKSSRHSGSDGGCAGQLPRPTCPSAFALTLIQTEKTTHTDIVL